MGVPIRNAKDTLLSANPGTLPNMGEALLDWFQQIKAIRIVKYQVNYQTVERGDAFAFQGVIQPFKTRELQMKPEGQRSWSWNWLHCEPTVQFQNDDVFYVGQTRYRVMALQDFTVYGYMEYQVIQDYQDQGAPPLPNQTTIQKFSQDITVSNHAVPQVVDVSGSIMDAFAAEWQLYFKEQNGTYTAYADVGAIEVTDSGHITFTVSANGVYKLTGVE